MLIHSPTLHLQIKHIKSIGAYLPTYVWKFYWKFHIVLLSEQKFFDRESLYKANDREFFLSHDRDQISKANTWHWM